MNYSVFYKLHIHACCFRTPFKAGHLHISQVTRSQVDSRDAWLFLCILKWISRQCLVLESGYSIPCIWLFSANIYIYSIWEASLFRANYNRAVLELPCFEVPCFVVLELMSFQSIDQHPNHWATTSPTNISKGLRHQTLQNQIQNPSIEQELVLNWIICLMSCSQYVPPVSQV